MDEYTAANRALWDGWTRIHEKSAFYDIEAFRDGRSTLNPVELEELGDVRGKTLLHLQCHFGLDTMSFARLGAHVTGVDFSAEAIQLARSLAGELHVPAEFVCADVYDVVAAVPGEFDVVFTSYGVIPWLPDLRAWARVIATKLRPGGAFHMVEFHPLADALDGDGRTLKFPYLGTGEPIHVVEQGSYADPTADFTHVAYQWAHGIGEVVSALLGAGLRLQFLNEHTTSPYGCHPFLRQRDGKQWVMEGEVAAYPLLYSLAALRD